MSGTLYIVGTPIGNIRDITHRAVDVLKSSDLIACEDTRHTKILLDHYDIHVPTTSYHKFNLAKKTKFIIEQVSSGKKVSLVSDAGMPGISDPGQELVQAAVNTGVKIEVIPGPSAAISALSVSSLPTDRFVFEGFLPVETGLRKDRLEALSTEKRTVLLYEAPHRLLRTLAELKETLGDRNISIARELTKKFEEVLRGKISEMIDKFTRRKPKGELVIVIEGDGSTVKTDIMPRLLINDLVEAGLKKSSAVKIVAKRLKTSKNELYRHTMGG